MLLVRHQSSCCTAFKSFHPTPVLALPQVKIPDDLKQRFLIDSMALYVLKDGCEFEQLMMMEQQGRPEFSFLFDLDSPEHIYYRWRLYSLAGEAVAVDNVVNVCVTIWPCRCLHDVLLSYF
jgi:hypothetical protein